MKSNRRTTRLINPALGLLLALAAGSAHAGGHVYTSTNPEWKTECGSCHIAYPPELMQGPSWRKLMTGLNDHFGTDASLDAKTAQTITRFLEANSAGGRKRGGETTLRISETWWFRHEHDEVPTRTWKNPAVKSAANCTACHTRAEQGDFSERTLNVPWSWW